MPEHPCSPVWRCFHCDEVFTDKAAAAEHFGMEYYTCDPLPPECLDATSPARKLARRARLAEAQALAANRARDEAEDIAAAHEAEMAAMKHQYGFSGLHETWAKFDTLGGRAIAAEATLAVIEKRFPLVVARARAATEQEDPRL